VILFAVPLPLGFWVSWESVEGLRGVTPWKVWNMPPWVGTGSAGAIAGRCFADGKAGITEKSKEGIKKKKK
jgi:hypothetical protein